MKNYAAFKELIWGENKFVCLVPVNSYGYVETVS